MQSTNIKQSNIKNIIIDKTDSEGDKNGDNEDDKKSTERKQSFNSEDDFKDELKDDNEYIISHKQQSYYDVKKYSKSSRTIAVMGNSASFYSNINKGYYPGLIKQVVRVSNASVLYLTFDTSNSASLCFSDVIRNYKTLKVRYCQYKVFFTFTNHPIDCDYNDIKIKFIKYLKSKILNIDILYFKLYKTKDKMLWCGDFTVDIIDHVYELTQEMSVNKTFTFHNCTGVFYKFIKNNTAY